MFIDVSGNIAAGRKIHYLFKLICGEDLSEFETLCTNIGHTIREHLKQIILELGTYFFWKTPCISKSVLCAMEQGSHTI